MVLFQNRLELTKQNINNNYLFKHVKKIKSQLYNTGDIFNKICKGLLIIT